MEFRKYTPLDKDSQRKKFGDPFPETWFVGIRHAIYFSGQQDIIQKMKPILTSQHRTVSLTGERGIGKTRIAIEYAYQERSNYIDEGVLFLNATSAQTLEKDFQQFAKNPEQNTDSVLEWINKHKAALVILDNINEELVQRFISCKSHLLVTSPTKINGIENIQIEKLNDRDGALLMLKRSNTILVRQGLEDASPLQQKNAVELSALLDGMPAQLEAVGKYIDDTGKTVELCLRYGKDVLLGLPETRAENPII